ncbi:MAG: DUF934 domain-containing protein [Methylophilaceae bacterium]
MSNLIRNNAIVADEWTRVTPPTLGEEQVRKQAGKVVLFKLTGEESYSAEQIAQTDIPAQGKILLPLAVWLARRHEANNALEQRLEKGELGIIVATHESLEKLVESVGDINRLPIIAIFVERFADGRIFSLGNLLRTRYGYRHELRAIGDVLRDQLFFLKRCGFDSYLIRADRSAQEALSGLQDFQQPYQAAVDIPQPAWRRIPR